MTKKTKKTLVSNVRAVPAGYTDSLGLRLRLTALCMKESQRGVARRLGFSPQFICDVLAGRRAVTDELAEALGYERIVLFRKGL